MKLVVRMILAAMLVCLPFGAHAQDVITGPKKQKKQTTAPAKKTPKKQPSTHTHYTLREMVEKGRNAEERRDYKEAAKWYRQAAQQGDVEGQFHLSRMYEYGWGVPRNYSMAVKMLKKSAAGGYPEAQYSLGVDYCQGYMMAHDYAEAMKWLLKASAQGSGAADYFIGYMYEEGKGVAKDSAEALRWYQRAAERGDPSAKNKLKSLK